ncbi:Major facilitator superfamily [Seminavis robusta]|uniref:Major facilitator superfamily n=1 Tax=Seminavis robusta TaxID=568900 RepID=A0A9N8H609_9STRA|nr:Major facilitator superfamily [Seminavis robusta]|eukprot:Sro100_g051220.1 Major facilitator superfamily (506) ;mRNA; f:45844-47550
MMEEEALRYKSDGKVGKERIAVDGGFCGCSFGNVTTAKGYCFLGTARSAIVMSNIFLGTALIFLASAEVGCVEVVDGKAKATDTCNQRVFGLFQPAVLITNIAAISGFVSALLMPVIGAVIDFTPHRWSTGVVSAFLLTVIQLIQITTNTSNWFTMAILQAVMGPLYHVQVLAAFSYLSDMSRVVDDQTWTRFTTSFTMVQFSAETLLLVVVVGISLGLNMDDVETAHVAQAVSGSFIVVTFTLGWCYMPKVEARNVLEDGKSLVWEGFAQNWRTWKQINLHYKRSLKWFLLGIMFSEPATNAFTVVSVVFLNDQLKMAGNEIGLMLLMCLIAMIPGSLVFYCVAHSTNPNTSLCFSMIMLFIIAVGGAFTLTPENAFPWAYIWGASIGLMLGCYYPSAKLFLSLVVPHGQEAEVTGFYVYSSQLLVWLPPLVFSLLVEAHVDQKFGVLAVGLFGLVSIFFFQMAAPFPELLDEIHNKDKLESWKSLKAQSPKAASFDGGKGTMA